MMKKLSILILFCACLLSLNTKVSAKTITPNYPVPVFAVDVHADKYYYNHGEEVIWYIDITSSHSSGFTISFNDGHIHYGFDSQDAHTKVTTNYDKSGQVKACVTVTSIYETGSAYGCDTIYVKSE